MSNDFWREEYFARVKPVIGEGLAGSRIAICNLAAVGAAAERLAGCSARRWALCDSSVVTERHPLARLGGVDFVGMPADVAFGQMLMCHNTWEDQWDFVNCAATGADYTQLYPALRSAKPDILLGGGTREQLRLQMQLAADLAIPAVFVAFPATGCAMILAAPDNDAARNRSELLSVFDNDALLDPASDLLTAEHWFAWSDANGIAAALARALLLDGADEPGKSLRRLFAQKRTLARVGNSSWPWQINFVDPTAYFAPTPPVNCVPEQFTEPGSVLVVGCGSLGSLAARQLVASGLRRIILVDGDNVEAANPVRQFFSTRQMGRNKAEALGENLAVLIASAEQWSRHAYDQFGGVVLEYGTAQIVCINKMVAAEGNAESWFARLLDETRTSAAVLATGMDADYALAAVLRAHNIPHVSGRCYPRSRYFEVLLVDGATGPCFNCLRGHLYTGPQPGPTPEERLLYDQVPAADAPENAPMPATIIDSGRAADVLARAAWEMAKPSADRTNWLRDLLDQEQTCLLGGNEAELVPSLASATDLEWAYGIALPGQVVAFGRDQIAGSHDTRMCYVCGRVSEVVYQL